MSISSEDSSFAPSVEELNGSRKGSETDNSEESTSKKTEEEIAKKESDAIFWLRVLVFIVMLLAAAAVSTVIYFVTKNGEVDEFESQYEGLSEQVIDAYRGIVRQKLGAIGTLRVSLIAYAMDDIKDWPFVTLSSFQQRAATARSLSESIFVGVYPLVEEEERNSWEQFVAEEGPSWINASLEYQSRVNLELFGQGFVPNLNATVRHPITFTSAANTEVVDPGPGPYMPTWQVSPLTQGVVNRNIMRYPGYSKEVNLSVENAEAVIGGFLTAPTGGVSSSNLLTKKYASLLSITAQKEVDYQGDPLSYVHLPIFDNFEETNQKIVGVLSALIPWSAYFKNVLPAQANGLICVLENPCQGPFTYRIKGRKVEFLGKGDFHERQFEKYERYTSFQDMPSIQDGTEYGMNLKLDYCPVSLRVYPSKIFYNEYNTNSPVMMLITVVMVFLFTAMMFVCYDHLVERRQKLVLRQALQTSAIVSSLFPQAVRDRLMEQQKEIDDSKMSNNKRLKSFLNEDSTKQLSEEPIADLFPHATVFFADIAGFTAWSSTREPAQVFILLQAIYQSFDKIAKRRKVFKVETIGDSYVAVTGIPDPQENHAMIMARFASECLRKMFEVTRELEVTLGPDTGDLSMRVGIHSGPVTAGVLRGERARFQLFGDTVNTAARMESTGAKGKIQISESTADLLTRAGKGHWVVPREDMVQAKGKGILNTFWLTVHASKGYKDSSNASQTCSSDSDAVTDETKSTDFSNQKTINLKKDRYVDWICELLLVRIRQVVAARTKESKRNGSSPRVQVNSYPGKVPMDEVVEAIVLPEFDAVKTTNKKEVDTTHLDKIAIRQLRDYVSTIASMYHDNPFHNFEHACHVTMSVNKLLTRVVTPDSVLDEMKDAGQRALASQLHDYTHGINSDPITLLAIIFGAVVHDADHRGCSNVQLMKEEEKMASLYRNQSVAEQNSLDIAWGLLMAQQFGELQSCIFATETDMKRFRQVMVNVVLATDIFDKELNDLRTSRWNKAFSAETSNIDGVNNLRATIVIEHIIQASDVSHTMQHWHVYRKWNQRLFHEMYLAYRAGRMGGNPKDFWYKGELGFFDNYVIPLARKLKECNVFGVSSDEYLNYAERNRAEWNARGQEIVEEMMEEVFVANPGLKQVQVQNVQEHPNLHERSD